MVLPAAEGIPVPLGWPLRSGGRLEELYLARVRDLPAGTQTLLLVAAADPTGDPVLVAKAASQLGTSLEAGEAAETRRLVAWAPRVRFRHPLIRSAAYYAAPAEARRRAHAALAAVTDPGADPTGGPGTGPKPPPGRMRRSPPAWNTPPAGPRPAAAWPPPPHSWNDPRC
jgi:hypothetical protein